MTWPEPPHPLKGLEEAVFVVAVAILVAWVASWLAQ